jgi:hypothetical protein
MAEFIVAVTLHRVSDTNSVGSEFMRTSRAKDGYAACRSVTHSLKRAYPDWTQIDTHVVSEPDTGHTTLRAEAEVARMREAAK